LLRRQLRIPHTFLNLPLALFLYLMLLTLIHSYDLFTGFKELVKWVQMGLVCGWWWIWLRGAPNRPFLPVFTFKSRFSSGFQWLLAGLSQALIGIWQFGLLARRAGAFHDFGPLLSGLRHVWQPNPFGGFMNMVGLLAWGLLLGLVSYGWRHLWQALAGEEGGGA
jgi:hypothetical protein